MIKRVLKECKIYTQCRNCIIIKVSFYTIAFILKKMLQFQIHVAYGRHDYVTHEDSETKICGTKLLHE